MARDDDETLTPLARVMRSQKRPANVISFPGLDGVKVGIVVPDDDELQEAQSEALKHLTSRLKLNEFQLSISLERNLYAAEEERQILQRALRDPSDSEASFGTIDELRKFLNPDTRKMLLRHLADWIDQRSPEKRLNGETQEVVEFVSDLKDEGALSEYLTSCDFGTLKNIAYSLAEALPMRTRPSSSGTSNSNTPSDSSSA